MASLLLAAAVAASALTSAHAQEAPAPAPAQEVSGLVPYFAPAAVRTAYSDGSWKGLDSTDYTPIAELTDYCPCTCAKYAEVHAVTETYTDPGYDASIPEEQRAPATYCYCSCAEILQTSTTGSGNLDGLDSTTFCYLHPARTECRPIEAEDATATLRFAWTTTQVTEADCRASTDVWGYCGDDTATVTFAVSCQALAESTNGTVQVLAPSVSKNDVDAFVADVEAKAAQGPMAEAPAMGMPVIEGPRAAGPAAEAPAMGMPAKGPAAVEPLAGGSFVDEPWADGPFADGPLGDGPLADGPYAAGPWADGPWADDPMADEPMADEPVADEPAVAPAPARRLLQETTSGAPATWYDMTVVNDCTVAAKPEATARTFKCGERDCDVLKVETVKVGACYSEADLNCGAMKQMKRSRCFSPQRKAYVTDAQDMEGSECADAELGFTIEDCADKVEPCPSGKFWRYQPWGACSASCQALECEGKALCTPVGERSRVAECVELGADGAVVVADSECVADQKEPSEGVACKTRCFNKNVTYKRVESECVATGVEACGDGTITITYELCADSSEVGCRAYADTEATTRDCFLGSCTPCEDFCVEANTLPDGAVADMTSYTCTCNCKDGFGGVRCHKDLSAPATEAKVLDRNGAVCASAVLDLERNCCQGALDGCGLCEGRSYEGLGDFRIGLDATGTCCHHTADTVRLTGDFTCCLDPEDIDECGVCNGDGSTCRKGAAAPVSRAAGTTFADFARAISAELPAGVIMYAQDAAGVDQWAEGAGAPAAARRLLQATSEAYGIEPTTAEVALAKIATGFFTAGQDLTLVAEVVAELPAPSVQGRADNGVCEEGEPTASSDCAEPAACPLPTPAIGTTVVVGRRDVECGGNGICPPVGGVCICSVGYTGDGCDQCDYRNKFVEVTGDINGAEITSCSLLATDQVDNSDPTPTTPPSPTNLPPAEPPTPDDDNSDAGGLSKGAIAGIAVGVIAGVAVIGAVAFYFVRAQGARDIGPA